MARMRERIFAGFGAVLFLGSASALTVFAISQGSGEKPTTNASACAQQQTGASQSVPQPYTTPDPVTELQTTDLKTGKGPAAKKGDCLVVKYYGTLATTGAKFDENFTTTTAFGFKLGEGQVIPGWDQGMVGIKVGGLRRLVIPAALGYGEQSTSAIPANSDLVFVVKLLQIKK